MVKTFSINQRITISKNMKILEKIAVVEGDYYTTNCFLYYSYFEDYYKMIAIDLSKQLVVDAEPKAIQQITN